MSNKAVVLVVLLAVGIGYSVINWQLTRSALASAEAELTTAQTVLEASQEELAVTRDKVVTLDSELEETEGHLEEATVELELTRESLVDIEAELTDAQARLAAIETSSLNQHNPTFDEAIGFLDEDRTDSNEYIEDEYVCSHFAADVNNNAEQQGIRCALVEVRFPDSGHAIVAFDTPDEGLVYFDPITDDRVRPVVGERYWRCIEPAPGYVYQKPSFNDTIVDVVVIW
jgi:hypothetical protein